MSVLRVLMFATSPSQARLRPGHWQNLVDSTRLCLKDLQCACVAANLRPTYASSRWDTSAILEQVSTDLGQAQQGFFGIYQREEEETRQTDRRETRQTRTETRGGTGCGTSSKRKQVRTTERRSGSHCHLLAAQWAVRLRPRHPPPRACWLQASSHQGSWKRRRTTITGSGEKSRV